MQGKRHKGSKSAASTVGVRTRELNALGIAAAEPASNGSNLGGSMMDADLDEDDASEDEGGGDDAELVAEIVDDTRKGEMVPSCHLTTSLAPMRLSPIF